MKVGNIGRLDPKLREKGIVGLSHGSKIEQMVWDEFYANPEQLAYESECLIAEYANDSIEHTANIDLTNLPEGTERVAMIKQRVNQSFFRCAVISSYDNKCCISGIRNPLLLEACHIKDWATDCENRTNPENGLCLNNLFHRAYDNFLMAITPDYTIVISDRFIAETDDELLKKYLNSLNGRTINLPSKFHPRKDFLDYHYQKYIKV